MKLTKTWLMSKGACAEGLDWFLSQKETDLAVVVHKLLVEKQFNWANWTVTRAMSHSQRVQYAIYAAKQVLDIFEKKYPKDVRPRNAIKAAEKWLKHPTENNKDAADAAYAAANAAYAAANAYAADAAYAAAREKLRKKILAYGLKLLVKV